MNSFAKINKLQNIIDELKDLEISIKKQVIEEALRKKSEYFFILFIHPNDKKYKTPYTLQRMYESIMKTINDHPTALSRNRIVIPGFDIVYHVHDKFIVEKETILKSEFEETIKKELTFLFGDMIGP